MKTNQKQLARAVRKSRVRKKIQGSTERPRLSVFRSSRYVYAQIINDLDGKTLVSCSSLEKVMKGRLKSVRDANAAKEVGKEVAHRAKAKSISAVVFDRNGYIYHGRVKAFADGAREGGLQF